jgi:hypothetical protein
MCHVFCVFRFLICIAINNKTGYLHRAYRSTQGCSLLRLHLLHSISIATDRVSIPDRYERKFSIASRRALGPTQPLMQCVPDSVFPAVKRQGSEVDHLTPSSADINNGGAKPAFPLHLNGLVLI